MGKSIAICGYKPAIFLVKAFNFHVYTYSETEVIHNLTTSIEELLGRW